jgi:hypothetical protein
LSNEQEAEVPTSRETGDLVVLGDITVQTDVFQVLSNKVCTSFPCSSTLSRRFKIIELLNNLGKALLQKLLPRNPGVESVVQTSPLNFILERLLQLLSSHDELTKRNQDPFDDNGKQDIYKPPISACFRPFPPTLDQVVFCLRQSALGWTSRAIRLLLVSKLSWMNLMDVHSRSCPSWKRHWIY